MWHIEKWRSAGLETRSLLRPRPEGDWAAGWRWFFWLQLWWVFTTTSTPTPSVHLPEVTAAAWALLLCEVLVVPLGLCASRWVGACSSRLTVRPFLLSYRRAFLASAVLVAPLLFVPGWLFGLALRSGRLKLTPSGWEWWTSGRADAWLSLVIVLAFLLLRVAWLRFWCSRRPADERPAESAERESTRTRVFFCLATTWPLMLLLTGHESLEDPESVWILAAFMNLLEGAAPAALNGVLRLFGRAPTTLGRWIQAWVVATAVLGLVPVLGYWGGTVMGWTWAWRILPPPVARLMDAGYGFDWRILVSVLVFWLLRLVGAGFLAGSQKRSATKAIV